MEKTMERSRLAETVEMLIYKKVAVLRLVGTGCTFWYASNSVTEGWSYIEDADHELESAYQRMLKGEKAIA